MSLEKWHWLVENIIASTNQIHVQNMVVSDNAEDSFVVIGCVLREELDNDASLGMWLDCSLGLAEREDVGLVREELESRGLTAVVADVQ
jgi:hypothetical protein